MPFPGTIKGSSILSLEMGGVGLSVTALLVLFLSLHASAEPLPSRKLLVKTTGANGTVAKSAPTEVSRQPSTYTALSAFVSRLMMPFLSRQDKP